MIVLSLSSKKLGLRIADGLSHVSLSARAARALLFFLCFFDLPAAAAKLCLALTLAVMMVTCASETAI